MKHAKPTRNTPCLRSQNTKAAKQPEAPVEPLPKTPSGQTPKPPGHRIEPTPQTDTSLQKLKPASNEVAPSSGCPSVLQRCLKQIIDKAEKAESVSIDKSAYASKRHPFVGMSQASVSNDYETLAPKMPKPQVPLHRSHVVASFNRLMGKRGQQSPQSPATRIAPLIDNSAQQIYSSSAKNDDDCNLKLEQFKRKALNPEDKEVCEESQP